MNCHNILAMDLGGTYIKAGLFNSKGVLISKNEALSHASKGGSSLLKEAVRIAEQFDGFAALGISTNGIVNTDDGSVAYANDNVPNLTGFALKDFFEQKFGVRAVVEGDVNAAAIGEMSYGAARGEKHFLCITFGTGVGSSLILDGKVYRGWKGLAGEVGHMITHHKGKECACGNLGCYEQYASVSALIASAATVDSRYTDGEKIFRNLFSDERLHLVVQNWLDEVITGLASVTHILSPPLIVLGGGILREEYVNNYLQDHFHQHVMPCYDFVKLLPAQLGNMSSVYGVMELAKQLYVAESRVQEYTN